MAKKLTKAQLELEERKIDILEKKQLIKSKNQEITHNEKKLVIDIINALGAALCSNKLSPTQIFPTEKIEEPILNEEEQKIIKAKYFNLLNSL